MQDKNTMLTQEDLKAIGELIDEKTKQLPTKDEFFSKMDEVVGELKISREEQTLQAGRISYHTDQIEDHEQRIEDLEKKRIPQSV